MKMEVVYQKLQILIKDVIQCVINVKRITK